MHKIQSDIDRQQSTITALKSHGHRCPDAENQLLLMKADLAELQ